MRLFSVSCVCDVGAPPRHNIVQYHDKVYAQFIVSMAQQDRATWDAEDAAVFVDTLSSALYPFTRYPMGEEFVAAVVDIADTFLRPQWHNLGLGATVNLRSWIRWMHAILNERKEVYVGGARGRFPHRLVRSLASLYLHHLDGRRTGEAEADVEADDTPKLLEDRLAAALRRYPPEELIVGDWSGLPDDERRRREEQDNLKILVCLVELSRQLSAGTGADTKGEAPSSPPS